MRAAAIGRGHWPRLLAAGRWIAQLLRCPTFSSTVAVAMTLFGSIQMGGSTLQAMQIGLQVVGNNIANADTPGYIREEANFVPAPVQRQGGLVLGLGVKVDSITEQLDKFIQERLTGARSDSANATTQEQTYKDLETVLNELSNSGNLTTSFSDFFNSVDEVLKNPGDAATRNLAIGKGESLAQDFNNLHSRVADIQSQLDERVTADAQQINDLTTQIQKLNLQIASTEGGNSSASQAGGLRVQRQNALDKLAQLVNIQVTEQPSGGVSVAVGGNFLVFEGQRREVEIGRNSSGASSGLIQFTDTHARLDASGGEVAGLYAARDQIAGGFLSKLDNLAGTLAFEFNKVYSQGQGLVGFQQLTSVDAVNNPNAALDSAGLAFTPESGTFNVLVHSKGDDVTRTSTINIDLDGLDEDDTLNTLAQKLDAIDGISASVTPSGELQISADSSDIEFAFQGDTSGALAALGINTFFTGSTAGSLGVNDDLKGIDNAANFAASLNGIGQDSSNAERLSAFFDQPLKSTGNTSLSDSYNQLVNQVTQGSATASSVADGYTTFETSLEGQQQAVSGVSIDEEAVNMLTLQRIYQASAKYIQTIAGLLDLLTQI